jgi:hypothetical protein
MVEFGLGKKLKAAQIITDFATTNRVVRPPPAAGVPPISTAASTTTNRVFLLSILRLLLQVFFPLFLNQ